MPAQRLPAFRWRFWELTSLLVVLFCGAELLRAGGSPQSIAAAAKRGKRYNRGNRADGTRRSVLIARHAAAVLPPLRDGGGLGADLSASRPAPAPATTPAAATAAAAAARVAAPAVARSTPSVPKKGAGRVRKGPPTDEEVMDEAQAAYVRGERQRAIDLAMSVAEKEDEQSTAAWRFIGLAACSVGSQRLATRAYQNLHAANDQRIITDACKHNGLLYRDDQFVGE